MPRPHSTGLFARDQATSSRAAVGRMGGDVVWDVLMQHGVTQHGPQDVEASSGQSRECWSMMFALGALWVAIRAGCGIGAGGTLGHQVDASRSASRKLLFATRAPARCMGSPVIGSSNHSAIEGAVGSSVSRQAGILPMMAGAWTEGAIGVADPLADHLGAYASFERAGRVGMPQIVEGDPR